MSPVGNNAKQMTNITIAAMMRAPKISRRSHRLTKRQGEGVLANDFSFNQKLFGRARQMQALMRRCGCRYSLSGYQRMNIWHEQLIDAGKAIALAIRNGGKGDRK